MLVAAASVRGVARSDRDVLSRPSEPPDVVLRWADHDDGVADMWLPPARVPAPGAPSRAPSAAPLLYVLHGGFWRRDWDRRHVRPLAQALGALGWVVVAPEYARVGGGRVRAGDAVWPLVADDLRTMRRRVPKLLAEVAPGRVATERPVLVGHSAGGQLALWWALDAADPDRAGAGVPTGDGADAGAAPRHVVGLAPVADLRAAHAAGLGDGAVQALLGAPQPGGSDPGGRAWASADPATRLRAEGHPPGCELTVVHGDADAQVPVAHSLALGADLPMLDVRVLPGVEHFALIDPLSAAWPAVRAALPPPAHPPAALPPAALPPAAQPPARRRPFPP